MGFYDTVPVAAPIIAVAIPVLMLLAAVATIPMVVQGRFRFLLPVALSSVTAALVGLILMIADPIPGITVTGGIARELAQETGYSSIDAIIGHYAPIQPGAGLIVAFVFSVLAAAAAVTLYIFNGRGGSVQARSGTVPPPGAVPPQPGGVPYPYPAQPPTQYAPGYPSGPWAGPGPAPQGR